MIKKKDIYLCILITQLKNKKLKLIRSKSRKTNFYYFFFSCKTAMSENLLFNNFSFFFFHFSIVYIFLDYQINPMFVDNRKAALYILE